MTIAQSRTSTEALAQLGDKVLLSAIVLSAVVSVALGLSFVDSGLAITATVLLLGLAFGVFAVARYTVLSRFVLAFVLVSFVALHIQLARGMEEMHFGVFVSLALFLTYRDWRVIVFGAVLYAIHHVVFDRLQAAGFGLYCITEPNFGRVVIHSVYVVIQSGVQSIMAINMARAGREGDELRVLVAQVNRENTIDLNVHDIPTTTRGGTMLRETLARMDAAVAAVRRSTGSIDVACDEIATGNEDLSNRTEQTAANDDNGGIERHHQIGDVHPHDLGLEIKDLICQCIALLCQTAQRKCLLLDGCW